jgi:hypothetical protein
MLLATARVFETMLPYNYSKLDASEIAQLDAKRHRDGFGTDAFGVIAIGCARGEIRTGRHPQGGHQGL